MDDERLIQTALECGASNSVVMNQEEIVLSGEFRAMCEANRCGVYGKCYMCPPDVGPIDELMKRLRAYDRALFYQAIYPLEDSFDFEGMVEAKKTFCSVSQRMLDALRPLLGKNALHLTGGGCGLCDTCAKITNEPCRYPNRALSSLECYGVNVSATAAHTSMKYINGPNTVTCFGMALYSENAYG